MTQMTFQIETGTSTDGVHVRIRDEISGTLVASFKLDAKQAFDFLRGSGFSVDGVMSDHLDRIGKQMVTESYGVPDKEIRDSDYRERVAVGERWARFNHPGWDTYDARRTNTAGVRVVVRKWVEA